MIDPGRVHDFETRRLRALDERFGFAIGRVILDGFRRTQLFYTVNRPCGLILDHIFAVLELKLPPTPSEDLDELGSIQVPVHPFVAERLAIEWADETRRYRNGDERRRGKNSCAATSRATAEAIPPAGYPPRPSDPGLRSATASASIGAEFCRSWSWGSRPV